jgi:hypothetical protein
LRFRQDSHWESTSPREAKINGTENDVVDVVVVVVVVVVVTVAVVAAATVDGGGGGRRRGVKQEEKAVGDAITMARGCVSGNLSASLSSPILFIPGGQFGLDEHLVSWCTILPPPSPSLTIFENVEGAKPPLIIVKRIGSGWSFNSSFAFGIMSQCPLNATL